MIIVRRLVAGAATGLLLVGVVAAPAFAGKSSGTALTSKVCSETFGGTWTHGKNPVCTVSSWTVDFTEGGADTSLVIPAKVTLVLNGTGGVKISKSGFTLTNNGTITLASGPGGSSSGGITVNSGGVFGNYGRININASGSLLVSSGGSAENYGTININSGGTFTNNGTYANHGMLFNYEGGTATNTGTATNDGTANDWGTVVGWPDGYWL